MVSRVPVFEAERLERRFGGLLAVSDVSLALHTGEIHTLIGPNGAGKSTVINLLSGGIAPSAGRIRLDGHDITAMSPAARARRGIGRSFQRTNVFPEFTAFENCRLAAQARLPGFLRLVRPARRYASVNAAAEAVLAKVGLLARADMRADTLSHGEQRQLEIAMALATEPRVLLLDEPLAGMGLEESQSMVALIGSLRADLAILVVEHDIDAIFALADRITVLVSGRVLDSGAPAAVRANPAVQDAYLGEGALHQAGDPVSDPGGAPP